MKEKAERHSRQDNFLCLRWCMQLDNGAIHCVVPNNITSISKAHYQKSCPASFTVYSATVLL